MVVVAAAQGRCREICKGDAGQIPKWPQGEKPGGTNTTVPSALDVVTPLATFLHTILPCYFNPSVPGPPRVKYQNFRSKGALGNFLNEAEAGSGWSHHLKLGEAVLGKSCHPVT